MAYDLKTIHAPKLSGASLLFAAWLLEHGLTRSMIAGSFLDRLGVDRLRAHPVDETPLFDPLVQPGEYGLAAAPPADDPSAFPRMALFDRLGTTTASGDGFRFRSVGDYARAYRDGTLSPAQVAERLIHVIDHQDRGNPPLYAFISARAEEIRRQAEESASRLAAGTQRSVFEGVPIAVKDELDVAGFCTTLGTSFINQDRATSDAFIVQRLRAAGAIIVGKTNMHEIGIGVTGLNPFHGTPVNPYAPWRYPGGSSSGSGSVVGSGICPVAIGADGGGSVRIPAAYCGVLGLKLTWGRVSARGHYPLAYTVANAGPIAANARDLALAYLAMAGPDPGDPSTLGQPTPHVDGFEDPIAGLRIGVFPEWFDHARDEVVTATRALLNRFAERGARIVEISIEGLDMLRIAHLVTISSEMRAAMRIYDRDHRSDFGHETRANLALAASLSTGDYLRAQQVRRAGLKEFMRVFGEVDVIATPTTANLPPRLNRDRLLTGISDLDSLSQTMRYAVPANMLGFPAITMPAGFVTAHSRHFWHLETERDEDGNIYSQVPVGLQLMAPHWQEALLLRFAREAEELVPRARPRVYLSPFEPNPVESGHETPLND